MFTGTFLAKFLSRSDQPWRSRCGSQGVVTCYYYLLLFIILFIVCKPLQHCCHPSPKAIFLPQNVPKPLGGRAHTGVLGVGEGERTCAPRNPGWQGTRERGRKRRGRGRGQGRRVGREQRREARRKLRKGSRTMMELGFGNPQFLTRGCP